MAPFLDTASKIAKKQVEDGHDFLLETFLTQTVLNFSAVKETTEDENVSVCSGCSWNTGRPSWWLTSAPTITSQLDKYNDLKGRAKNPIRMIKHVMLGFGESLREKDPQRLQSF